MNTISSVVKRSALAASLTFLLVLPAQAYGAHATPNHELRAAYLARFTEFIDWPPEPEADNPNKTFAICVFGDDPILTPLARLPQLLRVQGRQLEIRRVDRIDDVDTCQLLYVPAAGESHLGRIKQQIDKRPVLLVNETPSLPFRGQLITLFNDGDRLRLEVHLQAAQNAGFKITARLLKLAIIVDDRE